MSNESLRAEGVSKCADNAHEIRITPVSEGRPLLNRTLVKGAGLLLLFAAVESAKKCKEKNESLTSAEQLALETCVKNEDSPFVISLFPKNNGEFDGGITSAGESDCIRDGMTDFSFSERRVSDTFSFVALPEHILNHMLSFLPWRSILTLRAVNKMFFRDSLSFVMICRPPFGTAPAIFITVQEDLMSNERAVEAELASSRRNYLPSDLIYSSSSRASNSKGVNSSLHPAVERVFIGQLRRDGTVPMVKWLLLTVLGFSPDVLIAVENHRNKTSNRGKGCAWVSLRGEVIRRLLSYHHRIFFDSVNGLEGVWLVPPKQREEFAKSVSSRESVLDRPEYMPRNALVVEMPLSHTLPFSSQEQVVSAKSRYKVSSSPPSSFQQFSSLYNHLKPKGPWHHDPYTIPK